MELRSPLCSGPGPLVVAHRGAWEQAPQNSLAALEHAIELGCEMAELDVRRTRDGHLVALHDARLHGGASVASLDLVQLRERVAIGQAPLLEEMLECAAGRIVLDIELKTAECARPVLALLTGRLDPAGYVVTSFLAGAIAQLPEPRTGLVVRPGLVPLRLDERIRQAGASFLALPARLARAGLLAWAAQRGIECVVWTVNDRRVLRLMLSDPRVSAVITDRPDRALQLRAELLTVAV
jgi:glycerophosphoryl diester phosphodiesterase